MVFVSETSLDSGRVRLVAKADGRADRYVELEGPPDLIVEIVSDASVRKDTERLPAAYYRAGVAEYWLIDARGEDLLFRIHRRGPKTYEPTEELASGHQYSPVLKQWFRLDRSRNPRGRVAFDLDCRSGRSIKSRLGGGRASPRGLPWPVSLSSVLWRWKMIHRCTLAVLGIAWWFWTPVCDAADQRLPNFVIIFIDDMGYADIGPFGAKGYATPNLDRMAREGRDLHRLLRRPGRLLGLAGRR